MPERTHMLQFLPADDARFDDMRLQLHLCRCIYMSGTNNMSRHADVRRIHDLSFRSDMRRNSRADLRA